MKDIKTVMQRKKAKIAFCETLQEQEIRLKYANSERLFVSDLSYDFSKDEILINFFPLERYMGNRTNTHGNGKLYFAFQNVYKMNFDKYEGTRQ